MSGTTIYWRPTSQEGKCFKPSTPGPDVFNAIVEHFGYTLRPNMIPALMFAAIVAGEPIYRDIAATIQLHGEIEIWGGR
jgi:hypothetical protein